MKPERRDRVTSEAHMLGVQRERWADLNRPHAIARTQLTGGRVHGIGAPSIVGSAPVLMCVTPRLTRLSIFRCVRSFRMPRIPFRRGVHQRVALVGCIRRSRTPLRLAGTTGSDERVLRCGAKARGFNLGLLLVSLVVSRRGSSSTTGWPPPARPRRRSLRPRGGRWRSRTRPRLR